MLNKTRCLHSFEMWTNVFPKNYPIKISYDKGLGAWKIEIHTGIKYEILSPVMMRQD